MLEIRQGFLADLLELCERLEAYFARISRSNTKPIDDSQSYPLPPYLRPIGNRHFVYDQSHLWASRRAKVVIKSRDSTLPSARAPNYPVHEVHVEVYAHVCRNYPHTIR